MDIKAKIEEIVKKLQSDKTLLASFQREPIKTVEKRWISTCPTR